MERIMNNKDYNLFKTICSMDDKTIQHNLFNCLKNRYENVEFVADSYVCAIGNIPIALIAHMDTVWEKPPTNIYYDRERQVIWSPEGGIGDDRAGIFAIMKILKAGLRPTIIFTADEEMGGVGAREFIKRHSEPFTDLRYIIELDRQGAVDCVFYDCDNVSFVSYVESFGFTEAWGTFTDISVICPQWGIAGVNLSIGYENEHSHVETLNVLHMYKTIDKVKTMLSEEMPEKFDYIPSKATYGYFGPYSSWYDFYDNGDIEKCKCANCGKEIDVFEAIEVWNPYGTTDSYCGDCVSTHVDWCMKCGTPYDIKYGCPICGGR